MIELRDICKSFPMFASGGERLKQALLPFGRPPPPLFMRCAISTSPFPAAKPWACWGATAAAKPPCWRSSRRCVNPVPAACAWPDGSPPCWPWGRASTRSSAAATTCCSMAPSTACRAPRCSAACRRSRPSLASAHTSTSPSKPTPRACTCDWRSPPPSTPNQRFWSSMRRWRWAMRSSRPNALSACARSRAAAPPFCSSVTMCAWSPPCATARWCSNRANCASTAPSPRRSTATNICCSAPTTAPTTALRCSTRRRRRRRMSRPAASTPFCAPPPRPRNRANAATTTPTTTASAMAARLCSTTCWSPPERSTPPRCRAIRRSKSTPNSASSKP
ncbi:hypothetical protein MAIT1_01972 [Magnetofaba australis IT-1]|uniref:Uncharacterized protein n=1 Tax=Magnetofaba australis IT-1 TaxID=1434232 RepID=A0A1Y2K2M1_9PROT|nr:hypothetical protein MAIT1_01972 [Magnetofaba australis IT-1]